MKVVVTALQVWKVWLNYDIGTTNPPRWWVYVLASTATHAARMGEVLLKQEWDDGEEAVAVDVTLVCRSVVWEPAMIVEQLATSEDEKKR